MKNNNLQQIIENVNTLLATEKNNVSLVKKLIENEHLVRKETWSSDKEYRKKAFYFEIKIQNLWNTIYLNELCTSEKQEIDDFLYNDNIDIELV